MQRSIHTLKVTFPAEPVCAEWNFCQKRSYIKHLRSASPKDEPTASSGKSALLLTRYTCESATCGSAASISVRRTDVRGKSMRGSDRIPLMAAQTLSPLQPEAVAALGAESSTMT
jgi:hypothetical protein